MNSFELLKNRFIVNISLAVFINLIFSGCYTVRETNMSDEEITRIYEIETIDNRIIDFSDNKMGYAILSNNEVVSIKKNGDKEVYKKNDIKKYYTKRFSTMKTIGLVTITMLVLIPLAYVVILTQTKHTDKWGD